MEKKTLKLVLDTENGTVSMEAERVSIKELSNMAVALVNGMLDVAIDADGMDFAKHTLDSFAAELGISLMNDKRYLPRIQDFLVLTNTLCEKTIEKIEETEE